MSSTVTTPRQRRFILSPHLPGEEATALFIHWGSRDGRLSNEKLLATMLAPRSRPAAAEQVRKAAFPFGQATAWAGKILYRQCRSGVYAPSDWDPNLALRSSQARARGESDISDRAMLFFATQCILKKWLSLK